MDTNQSHADFYIVKHGDTLSRIAQQYLGEVSQWKILHHFNPHIVNPDLIRHGDVIYLPPIGRQSCSVDDPSKEELLAMSAQMRTLTMAEQELVRSQGETLQQMTEIKDSHHFSASQTLSTSFEKLGHHGHHYYDSLKIAIKEIEVEYLKIIKGPLPAYQRHRVFVSYRKKRLQELVRQFGNRAIAPIRERSRQSFLLRLMRKPGRGAFVKQLKALGKKAKIYRSLGYIAMAIENVESMIKIKEAWGTSQQMRTLFAQTGKITVGLSTSAIATYLTCNIILGIETAGTSLLICGVMVGSAGAIVGSYGGEIGGANVADRLGLH